MKTAMTQRRIQLVMMVLPALRRESEKAGVIFAPLSLCLTELAEVASTEAKLLGAEVDATTSIACNSVTQRARCSLRRASQAEVLFYEFQVPRKRALLIGDDDFQAKLHRMIVN